MFNEMLSSMISGLLIALPFLACVLLIVAAFTDLTRRLIPNWISVCLFLMFSLFAISGEHKPEIWQNYMWAAGVFIGLLPLFALKKIGGGDVKLLTMTMLWIGPVWGVEFLVLTTLIGGVMALIVISPRARLLWEWGNAKFGSSQLIDFYPEAQSLPYGVAIAAAGIFVINDIYFGHLVGL
ncbi:MAG: prepilin peptidase [Sneathiella sp.]